MRSPMFAAALGVAAFLCADDTAAHHNPPVEAFCSPYEEGCPRRTYTRGFEVRISPVLDAAWDEADLGLAMSHFTAQLGFLLDPMAAKWGYGVPASAMGRLLKARVAFYIHDSTLPDPMAEERWWPCHGGSCYNGQHRRVGLNTANLLRAHFNGYIVLHELAHAYHHLIVPGGYRNECIVDAYEAAMEKGLYVDMKRDYRRSGKPAHAGYGVSHGLTLPNHIEYFAHGTTAYFWRNHTYPFNRHDLHEYDSRLYWIVRRFWDNPGAACPTTADPH